MSETKRRRKYGVWLRNHTDYRDDDWTYVYAKTASEAESLAQYDSTRFSIAGAEPIAKFRKRYRIEGL